MRKRDVVVGVCGVAALLGDADGVGAQAKGSPGPPLPDVAMNTVERLTVPDKIPAMPTITPELVDGLRARFGARYGGLWLEDVPDRPTVVIGLIGPTPAEELEMAAAGRELQAKVTAYGQGDFPVRVQSVRWSETELEAQRAEVDQRVRAAGLDVELVGLRFDRQTVVVVLDAKSDAVALESVDGALRRAGAASRSLDVPVRVERRASAKVYPNPDGPGISYGVSGGGGGGLCSTAFVFRAPNGIVHTATAGHCGTNGHNIVSSVNGDLGAAVAQVSTFAVADDNGVVDRGAFASNGAPLGQTVYGTTHNVSALTIPVNNDVVCFRGGATAHYRNVNDDCGYVGNITPTRFDTYNGPGNGPIGGDSGAGAYHLNPDGTAAMVGIVIQSPGATDPNGNGNVDNGEQGYGATIQRADEALTAWGGTLIAYAAK